MSDFDDYLEPEPEERPRDAQVDAAIASVLQIFENEPSRVFYSTQIETVLERIYFHWITNKALAELAAAGLVQKVSSIVVGNKVNFYSHIKNRYWKRDAAKLQTLLEKIFDPDFTRAIGQHAELQCDSLLARNGFMPQRQKNVSAWNGKIWTRTKHNLDRIVTKDGVAYGVEIKNTQNYIPKIELEIKLDLCRELELVPLFIMRFAPKSYMHQINLRRGFGLLYERQIYPLGHNQLLREVQQKIGLKVQAPLELEQGFGERLSSWHEKTRHKS